MINIFAATHEVLKDQFSQDEISAINKYVFNKRNFEIEKWENVKRSIKDNLKQQLNFTLPEVVYSKESIDGTYKFLLKLEDGHTIETVLIRSKDRLTLCVSSQVGCSVGCTFCHTATQGFTRNLKTDEIIGQYMVASGFTKEKISNVVFMGQGEPLLNFQNVKKAIEIFLRPEGLALSRQKVTLSTSGLVPQINNWEQFPDINVAISLHASRDNLRSELMPINQIHNLKNLFEALKNIPTKNSKRISFEYLLIRDLNDQEEDVQGLTKLLKDINSKINLIPFNEYPGTKFKSPTKEKVLWFQNRLHECGMICTIRETKGDDILAACGQLKSQVEFANKM